MLQCISTRDSSPPPFGQIWPFPGTRTAVTRPPQIKPSPRRSLFQAGAPLRFVVAAGLATLLWGAILWALA